MCRGLFSCLQQTKQSLLQTLTASPSTTDELHYNHPALCLFTGVSSAMFVVSQGPDVSVMEWEAASISCCWTEKLERTSVNWLKNQKEFKSESIISKTKCPEEQCTCSTLTFTKITRGDSGTYVCRVTVEIPVYTVVEGNGTVITVGAREPETGHDRDAGR